MLSSQLLKFVSNRIPHFIEKPPLTLRSGLEALVALEGRPAVRVRDTSLELDHEKTQGWFDVLATAESSRHFSKVLDGIGRIDYKGRHCGTGFVVRAGLILTNRHVVQKFMASKKPSAPIQLEDLTIDFSDTPTAEDSRRFRIISVAALEATPVTLAVDLNIFDAILLEVEEKNDHGAALPAPLVMLGHGEAYQPAHALVVGYPGRPDLSALDVSMREKIFPVLNAIFSSDYGTKYASPCELKTTSWRFDSKGRKWVISHDATTLGGSSGSCMVGLQSPYPVIGLHIGGTWLKENFVHAIGGPAAREDTFLNNVDLNWTAPQ